MAAVVALFMLLKVLQVAFRPESHRRKACFAQEKLAENRLVRKSEGVGYLVDVHVGVFEHSFRFDAQQFRKVEPDRMSARGLDYP